MRGDHIEEMAALPAAAKGLPALLIEEGIEFDRLLAALEPDRLQAVRWSIEAVEASLAVLAGQIVGLAPSEDAEDARAALIVRCWALGARQTAQLLLRRLATAESGSDDRQPGAESLQWLVELYADPGRSCRNDGMDLLAGDVLES